VSRLFSEVFDGVVEPFEDEVERGRFVSAIFSGYFFDSFLHFVVCPFQLGVVCEVSQTIDTPARIGPEG